MPADRCATDVEATLREVGEHFGARPGHMFGHPALYAGRRLAVCAYGAGLGMKLSAERVSELVDTGRAVHFRPYNKPPMREWAYQPVTSSNDVVQLADLIAEAIEFAREATPATVTHGGRQHRDDVRQSVGVRAHIIIPAAVIIRSAGRPEAR